MSLVWVLYLFTCILCQLGHIPWAHGRAVNGVTFLSIGICLGEKHKAFVSSQQLQLWDLWIVLEYTPMAVLKAVAF